MALNKGIKVALAVALVGYFINQDMRSALMVGGAALAADMVL